MRYYPSTAAKSMRKLLSVRVLRVDVTGRVEEWEKDRNRIGRMGHLSFVIYPAYPYLPCKSCPVIPHSVTPPPRHPVSRSPPPCVAR